MNEPKKKFDAAEMQRQIRERMSREMEGMSFEEIKQYYAERIRRWKPEWPGAEHQQREEGSSVSR